MYGKLAPGRFNERVLAEVDGEWEAAKVSGKLVQQGWGDGMGYLAITLAEGAGEVEGFLFVSEYLEDHWDRLDHFEGDRVRAGLATAQRANCGCVDAQVYVHKVR